MPGLVPGIHGSSLRFAWSHARARVANAGRFPVTMTAAMFCELLGGGISPDRLSGLKAAAEAARSDAEGAEPGLKDALEAIDHRAQVEFAKLTVPKAQARSIGGVST